MTRRNARPDLRCFVFCALASLGGCARSTDWTVEPWQPLRISSPEFESHAAFDPRNGDLYFVRSSPKFEGWRLLVSRCTAEGWAKPEPPAFAGDGVEADPFVTPDGRSLYFISSRTTDGVRRADTDVWRVDRGDRDAWGTPVRLPEPVNSKGYEWFPRLAHDGWLYFGSGRPGGSGRTDIWRARPSPSGAWSVENLGDRVNSAANEYEAEPSKDGRFLLVLGDGGAFESRLGREGWGPRRRLGARINVNGTEIGALLSPQGHAMLFARDTEGPLSGEFFLARDGRPEDWPPRCPR